MSDSLSVIIPRARAATWPFTAISTCLFFMRAVSRMCLMKNAAGWDDAILLVSWVLDILRESFLETALDAITRITPRTAAHTIPTAGFWLTLVESWAFLSIALPKLSVGILIIRVFNPQPWLKVTIMVLCVSLNILSLGGFLFSLLDCDPVAGQWDPVKYPSVKCHRLIQIIYSCVVSGLSAFMDLAFSLYPGYVIWGLQMPRQKKVAITLLMSLGLASFAFAVVKLVSNGPLIETAPQDFDKLLYLGIVNAIWNSVENDFVLSAACLPAVPPAFRVVKEYASSSVQSLKSRYSGTLLGTVNPTGNSGRSERVELGEATELASNGQPPGYSNGKAWVRARSEIEQTV